MKQFKVYFLALASCILLTGCPSDADDNNDITPVTPSAKEYSETMNIPAKGCDETISLNKLRAEVTSVSSTPSWLAVTIQPYTSGAPSIKLTVGENLGDERRHTVAIYTYSTGDKLNLTIVQAAKTVPGQSDSDTAGIDDLNDKTSNKPAYAPRR